VICSVFIGNVVSGAGGLWGGLIFRVNRCRRSGMRKVHKTYVPFDADCEPCCLLTSFTGQSDS